MSCWGFNEDGQCEVITNIEKLYPTNMIKRYKEMLKNKGYISKRGRETKAGKGTDGKIKDG